MLHKNNDDAPCENINNKYVNCDAAKIIADLSNEKNAKKYMCEPCDYITSNKFDFSRHCDTRKHKCNQKNAKTPEQLTIKCEHCSKEFETNSGLWRHSKKCKHVATDDNKQMTVFLDYLKKRDENDMKKNADLKNMVIELCKVIQLTGNNSNSNSASIVNSHSNNTLIQNNSNCNNTTNNNSFNLNFFLNETCKDALNMSDFIKSIQVGFEDIERIGNIGYIDGISSIIIKSLQELGVEKRPIHCTDAKRQTLYIKENNEWTKEDSDWSHLQHMVNEVQKINLRQLPAWREQHPNCLTSSSKYTNTYNTMSQELMGGDCKKVKMQVKDNKIMNKILKEVIIDKSLFLGDNK
jgi:hypothetical protein